MPIDADTFEQGTKRYSIEEDIIQLLYDDTKRAYNVHEITVEVMKPGWSKSNVEFRDFDEYVGCLLDLATVRTIVDQLVDDGEIERRILDTEDGKRSYYRAR